ncbi:helix-turn-helix transcriptional regulator [Nocardia cyriacigeorgica]|uniref:helix-turn-helix domain-containing protein n=1 Tax=Nocardia cyriacigeorgica TaxID=135487 RepID=UPI00189526DF|nr:helix-turn-helix transcriptional regulator [Nocardia cyriacigeorgica]MBF6081206.1 helix-turn-helix transcriptional regulator [Nocardia cyriacigeorgica]MBF6089449.1 helix-turn-helix transcriptional regulator [Nocardia cyriacigeorgica]MBF6158844.1 helix-turn-helix transcriptional regulator [Nocardia cyriacigeorgica]MBF6197470.1 helix-turn-helix transcriptional regulator [Nocardia cyriacigeorgica]MBF6345129.1 helix-turn-helix transcriptional regulator [Nocardia cyriacigeorgica]
MRETQSTLGSMLGKARLDAGMTQQAVASQCRVSRSYIAHIEAGRSTPPDRRFWMAADAAVRAGGALVSAYDAQTGRQFTVGPTTADLHLSLDLKAWIDMNRRELLSFLAAAGTLPAAAVLAGLDEPDRARLGYALGGRVDEAAIRQLEAVCDVTAQQYEAFGPRAVAAIRRGQAELVETLLPDCPSKLKPRLHAVRASLARVIGWQAYDAGDIRTAATHYEVARKAADDAGDPALTALVLCNASLAATRDGRPGLGVDHATAAHWWATRASDRLLAAYALDMAAEAHAERGDARETRSALAEADDLVQTAETGVPTWVFDRAIHAGFASECLVKLGDRQPAVDAARDCVDLIDPAYALSRGFADIGLAAALCHAGDIDEAAALTCSTSTVATAYGSPRLAAEVQATHTALRAAAPNSAAVRELDAVLAV